MVISGAAAPTKIQVEASPAIPAYSGGQGNQPSDKPDEQNKTGVSPRRGRYDLPISDQLMMKSIERANRAMLGMDRRFEYSIHEKTGDVLVKVIDTNTDEVVREIPNEKFLDLIANLQELIGLNIDEKR